MKRETWIAGVIVCGAVVVLGAFLPWVTAGILSLSGMSGDGIFAIAIGGAMIVAGVAGFGGSRPAVYGVQLLGGLAFALAAFEWFQLSQRSADSVGAGSTGLLAIAGAGLVAAIAFGANAPEVPAARP